MLLPGLKPQAFIGWLLVIGALCCSPARPVESGDLSQAGPPPPGRVPSYAAVVTATAARPVRWPPGSLAGRYPPFDSDRVYSSVQLRIVSWRQDPPGQTEILHVDQLIEAYCVGNLSDATNQRVTVRLRMSGDTRGVRWTLGASSGAANSPNELEPDPNRVEECPKLSA